MLLRITEEKVFYLVFVLTALASCFIFIAPTRAQTVLPMNKEAENFFSEIKLEITSPSALNIILNNESENIPTIEYDLSRFSPINLSDVNEEYAENLYVLLAHKDYSTTNENYGIVTAITDGTVYGLSDKAINIVNPQSSEEFRNAIGESQKRLFDYIKLNSTQFINKPVYLYIVGYEQNSIEASLLVNSLNELGFPSYWIDNNSFFVDITMFN